MSRTFLPSLGMLVLGLALLTPSAQNAAQAADEMAKADQLVAQALEAEARGETAERHELLKQALVIAPDHAPARWHAGFVKRDGQWLTIEAAQQQAALDDRMPQYWQLAAGATMDVKDQLRLARWCTEQGLEDLAHMHWYRVHRQRPLNKEAAKQLGLQEYEGEFLAPAQIAAAKRYQAASQQWTPLLQSWKEAFQSGSESARTEALQQLRQVNDEAAIPFLINQCADDITLAKEVVSILAGMSPLKTYGWISLFAVEHDDADVLRGCHA